MNIYWRSCLTLCVLSSLSLGAESYVSMQWGLSGMHSDVDVDVYAINYPTYCDSLLYPNPNNAPTDGACAPKPSQKAWAGLYTPDTGWYASLGYGRVFGSWRFEGVFERNQFRSADQLLPLATSGDSAIESKTNEWSQHALPNNSYDDQGTSTFTANVLRDFDIASGRSAYVGAGLGVAFVDFNYGTEFLRKTVGEGYLDVPSPIDWPTEAKVNAAGSLSAIEEAVQQRALTYCLIAGFDVDRGQDVTVGVRVTWRVIGDVEHDNALWSTIRSHAPVLADGSTPFESDFVFKSRSYLTVGLVATRRIGRSTQ